MATRPVAVLNLVVVNVVSASWTAFGGAVRQCGEGRTARAWVYTGMKIEHVI